MKNYVVQDIWDREKLPFCSKFPAEKLTPEEVRTAIGMERVIGSNKVSYFIPTSARM